MCLCHQMLDDAVKTVQHGGRAAKRPGATVANCQQAKTQSGPTTESQRRMDTGQTKLGDCINRRCRVSDMLCSLGVADAKT